MEYAQIAAIILVIDPDGKPKFYICNFRASLVTKVALLKLDPFPILKYCNSPACIDEIDVVNKPAFVVPSSGLRTDSIESNVNLRKRIYFTALPYSFIDRSDWDDLNRGAAWADTEVAKGESLRLISYVLPPENKRMEIINICKQFVDIPTEELIDFHSLARIQNKDEEVNPDMGEEDNEENESDNNSEVGDESEQTLLNKFS